VEAKLSETSELLFGITLLVLSTGIFVACLPRNGKTVWIVRKPFLAPALTVLIIGGFAMGLIELTAYFTAVDDISLSGKLRQ
jgi:hypothetical protein